MECNEKLNIHQINKLDVNDLKRKDIFPITVTSAVFDKQGNSLEAILLQTNNIFLSYKGSNEATRITVPLKMRRKGLIISYKDYDGNAITEKLVYDDSVADDIFKLDSSWTSIGDVIISGEISISPNGTWIIDGKDSGIKAVGPKGDNGLSPIVRTNNNKLEYSYDGTEWTVISDYVAAWFRFENNKIQISRDNKKTWTDLSESFTKNLYIKGYVANVSALPTNATQGDIYMVGPQTSGGTDYLMYIKDSTGWKNNGSFTSITAGIVQTFGNSETEVISQKSITENILGNPFCYSGAINPNNGNIFIPSDSELYLYTDYIPIDSNSKVRIRSYGSNNISPCAFYDINKTFISTVEAIGSQVQNILLDSNIPSNAKYIRCSGRTTDNNYITINSIDIVKHIDNIQLVKNEELNSILRQSMVMNEYLYPLVFEDDTAILIITSQLNGKKYNPSTNDFIDDINYNCYQIDISSRIGEILHIKTIKDSSATPISLTDNNNICINSYGLRITGSDNIDSYFQILTGSKYVYINKYIVEDNSNPYAAIVSTASSQIATLNNFHEPLQKDMIRALGTQGYMFIYPYKAFISNEPVGDIRSTYNYHLGIFKLQSNQGTLKLSKGNINANTYAFYRGEELNANTFIELNTTGKIPSNAKFVACNFSITNNKLEDLYFIEVFNDGTQKVFEKILRKGKKIAINPINIVEGNIWNDSNEAEERSGYSYADYPYSGEKNVCFNGAFNGINLWVFTFINDEGKTIGRQQRRDYSTYNPLYADGYEVNPIIGTSIIRVNYATSVPPAITAYERTDYIDAINIDDSLSNLKKHISSYKEEEINYDTLNSTSYIRLNGSTQVDVRFQSAIFTIPELDDNSELLFSAKIGSSTSIAFLYFYDESSNLIDREYIYNTSAEETITKLYEKIIVPDKAKTIIINSIANITPRLFKRVYENELFSNNINNSVEQIKDDLYIAVKDENIVPLDIVIEDGYLRSDGRIWTNQTDMRHTSLFPIKGGVKYQLNCKTAGLAYNLLYDNTGTVIVKYFQQQIDEQFITPSNAYYIALSLAANIEAKDINIHAVENVLKSNSSGENEIISETPQNSYDIVNSGDFRLFFSAKLLVDLNRSSETINLCTLSNSNKIFTIDAICRTPIPYSQNYSYNNISWVTEYPYANAQSGFGFTINGQQFAYANRSYPAFGELKGTELFRIRYTGDADSSNHTIEITDTNLIITDGINNLINLTLSDYNTIEELVNALTISNFEVSVVGAKRNSPISAILKTPPTKLVSTYTNSVSAPVLRKEAYPFVVYDSMYYRNIYFELVRVGSKVCLNIDGQNDGSIIGEDKSVSIQDLNSIFNSNFNILFNNEAIEVLKVHININNSGNAQILNCNRICSDYSKIFASWSAHGIYDGKTTNGKKPIYEDETVTDPNTELAVIPVKYKQWIASGPLSAILTSSERMLYLLELTRTKGYVQLNGDDYLAIFDERYDNLPNKSFIWFNDDKHIYMYSDPQTRRVLVNSGFVADFAASKWSTYTEVDKEEIHKMNSLRWKHYIHGEYDEIIFALTYNQLYTDDNTVALSICRNLAKAYPNGISESVWVTSNGLQSPNGINAFNYWGIPLSYNVGLGTGIYICRASNPLNLPRLAIGETRPLSNVVNYSII